MGTAIAARRTAALQEELQQLGPPTGPYTARGAPLVGQEEPVQPQQPGPEIAGVGHLAALTTGGWQSSTACADRWHRLLPGRPDICRRFRRPPPDRRRSTCTPCTTGGTC
jgi:hypothetical protein